MRVIEFVQLMQPVLWDVDFMAEVLSCIASAQ